MKTIKRIYGIFIFILMLGLIIIKLMANKKEQKSDLQALLDYSYTVPVEVTTTKYEIVTNKLSEHGVTLSDKDIDILSQTQGEIIHVFGEIGDRVNTGQVLVKVEKEVLESQLEFARLNLDKATKDVLRFKKLVAGNAATQQKLEEVELHHQNAKTEYTTLLNQLENTTLKSPISGFISSVSIEKGSVLSPGVPVMTISAQDDMNFMIRMAEKDITKISKGQEASINIDVFSNEFYKGKVKEIGVIPDLAGRYGVTIHMMNPDLKLRSGMTGNATFSFTQSLQQIILPRGSIVGSVQKASVFVVQGDTVAEKNIQVQSINPSEVAVLHGLQAGEKVVVTGHMNIQDGTTVNIINR